LTGGDSFQWSVRATWPVLLTLNRVLALELFNVTSSWLCGEFLCSLNFTPVTLLVLRHFEVDLWLMNHFSTATVRIDDSTFEEHPVFQFRGNTIGDTAS
jgi:hypothetical protein